MSALVGKWCMLQKSLLGNSDVRVMVSLVWGLVWQGAAPGGLKASQLACKPGELYRSRVVRHVTAKTAWAFYSHCHWLTASAAAKGPPFCRRTRRISQFQQDAQLAAQLARDAWHQAQQEHVDQQLAAALTQESHALYRSGSLPAQQQHELLDQQTAAELAKDGSGCVSELQDRQLAAALAEKEQQKAQFQATSPSQEQELREMNSFLLEELQARVQADSGSKPCGQASSDPYHWSAPDPTSAVDSVQLIELPLPGQEGSPELPAFLKPQLCRQMTEQGIPPRDAVAALLACDGDGDEALVMALTWQDKVGMAELTRQSDPETANKLQAWAGLAEAELVLQRFSKGGMQRERVKRIERIQNRMLWARFALRQSELRQKHGHDGDNQQMLFHGADKATLEVVIKEGCDTRVCNKAGSLGLGTYFAEHSKYSAHYSQAARRAALNTNEIRHLEQQPSEGQSGGPAFLPKGFAMLLCRVALGKTTIGQQGLRRSPPSFDSVCRDMDRKRNDIFAVFDNNQSYPEYVVHYQ
ncbi:hypothetical protein WJX84_001873 [Apatococcus fuscideae]|uniref:Poly [ADP-ribose] polymerase n=1 Tax=Apatococcus fuscideae TaxID=2026836 RepID=A0AAW1SRR7_9CHLO